MSNTEPPIMTHQRQIAVEMVVRELLGDVDSFVDFLDTYQKKGLETNAERMLRTPDRIHAGSNADVFCAALISADRNDAEEACRCLRLLIGRYLLSENDRMTERVADYEQESAGAGAP
jgi:hypothetical protein